MRRLLLAVLLLLSPCSVWAGTVQIQAMMGMWAGTSAGGGDYSDIAFWWRAQSSTLGTGDYPTTGLTPTVDFDDGSGYTVAAAHVGTYGLELKTWDKITWPVSGVNTTAFRVGFWITFKAFVDDYLFIGIQCASGGYGLTFNGTDELWLNGPWGSAIATSTANVVIDTPYYIELVIDDTNDYVKLFINNAEIVNTNISFTNAGAVSAIQIGGNYGSVEFNLGNFAITNDISRSLYLLRNSVSSPR